MDERLEYGAMTGRRVRAGSESDRETAVRAKNRKEAPMIRRDTHSLGDIVKEEIIKMIQTEQFPDNRLPSERELGERFGVSVTVVREALLLLREDGVVTKKHGLGNFFHLSALNSGVRIDQYPGFRDLLTNLGHAVTEEIRSFQIEEADEQISEILEVEIGDQGVHYERGIYADGEPAILCNNFLPLRLFPKEPTLEQVQISLFDVFRDVLNKELAYGQLQFFPHNATENEKELFGIPKGKAMIIMRERYFSLEDILLAYSDNYLNGKYITVNMLSR